MRTLIFRMKFWRNMNLRQNEYRGNFLQVYMQKHVLFKDTIKLFYFNFWKLEYPYGKNIQTFAYCKLTS